MRPTLTLTPGTIRDTVEEVVNLRSIPLHLPDATGITPTANLIEQIGVQRSRAAESAAVIAVANKTLDTHL